MAVLLAFLSAWCDKIPKETMVGQCAEKPGVYKNVIEYAETPLVCSACGGTERMRPYSPWHRSPICRPCFMIWYDPDEAIDVTDPQQVGALSRKLKAAGRFPWV